MAAAVRVDSIPDRSPSPEPAGLLARLSKWLSELAISSNAEDDSGEHVDDSLSDEEEEMEEPVAAASGGHEALQSVSSSV